MKALILILFAGSMLALPCPADIPGDLPPFPPLLLTADPPQMLPQATPPPQFVFVPAPAAPAPAGFPMPGWAITCACAVAATAWLAAFALKKVIEILPLVSELMASVRELTGRADRSAAKTGSLEARLTSVAMAVPAAPAPAVIVPVQAPADAAPCPDAAPAPASAPSSGSVVVPAIFALMACSFALLGAGCATDTGDPSRDRRGRITNAIAEEVFNGVLQVGLTEGANALAGQNGQDAAAAAFSAAGRIDGAAAISRVIAAAGPHLQPVAAAAAQQYAAADPRTAAEKALVVNTIGAAIQIAANQQPAR